MNAARHILCDWDGESFTPSTIFMERQAQHLYETGKRYRMVEEAERSQETHRHYFATLRDLYDSLPGRFADEPWAQSCEHLRAFALIKTKFCNATEFPCGSRAEADRWAANLRPLDEYSIVTVRGTVVTRFTAKSQSYKAMPDKGEFQASKQAVLDYVSDLIGLPADAEQRRAA